MTIDERAEEYAKRKSGCQPWQYASSAYRSYKQIYIDVATEQQETDTNEFMEESLKMLKAERERVKAEMIEKSCELYEKELRQMKRILNEVKEGAGKLISVGGSLAQFCKAMKEE